MVRLGNLTHWLALGLGFAQSELLAFWLLKKRYKPNLWLSLKCITQRCRVTVDVAINFSSNDFHQMKILNLTKASIDSSCEYFTLPNVKKAELCSLLFLDLFYFLSTFQTIHCLVLIIN